MQTGVLGQSTWFDRLQFLIKELLSRLTVLFKIINITVFTFGPGSPFSPGAPFKNRDRTGTVERKNVVFMYQIKKKSICKKSM